MMTNVMVKTCLCQKIKKNSNLIQAMKRIAYVRKRELSEDRIFPKAEFVRIITDCSVAWIEHTTW